MTRSTKSGRAVAALLLAALLACGGSAGPTGPPPGGSNGTGTVTPAGGTVTLGAEAGVTVPAGAVDAPLTIAIERVAAPPELESIGALGQSYRFSPAGHQFRLPIEIFVFVPDAALQGFDQGSLALHSSGGAGATAAATEELANIRREPAAGGILVRGHTSHFSIVSATAEPLPVADAGPDRTVSIGEPTQVIGVGSDPSGGPVSIAWTLISRPAGSTVGLSETDTAKFTPDIAGDYVLRLTVTKAGGASAADEVTITAIENTGTPPVADAGADLTGDIGIPVTLDGSGSTGAAPLSFAWRFLQFPGASPPRLEGPPTAPSFTPQAGGTYVVELTVSNGFGSGTDTARIDVNSPPIAGLSAPSGVVAGASATVADVSTDPDGDPLTSTWSFTPPVGSAATLSVGGGGATFSTDVTGFYDVALTVHDGRASATANARVAAVPLVAGIYTATFTLDPAPACQVEGATYGPGDLPITQAQDRFTLRVSDISDGKVGDITGPIRPDGSFDFVAPVRVVSNGQTFTASPRWTGRFLPSGALDARFSVSVFTCVISGSVVGTLQ